MLSKLPAGSFSSSISPNQNQPTSYPLTSYQGDAMRVTAKLFVDVGMGAYNSKLTK